MRRRHFLIPFILLFAMLSFIEAYAHTISRDLEQTYSRAYLLLFVLARLLPFVGLGILAFKTNTKEKTFQIRWQFFVCLFLGLLLGYHLHNDFSFSILNQVGLIFIGILLIFTKSTEHKLILGTFLLFGLSLGFEYGRSFLHTENFMWFYILTLGAGSGIFALLNNFQIIGNPKFQIPLNIFGLFLIVSGIVLVLLS